MFREKIDAKVQNRLALLTGNKLASGEEVKPPKNWNKERTLQRIVEVCTTIEEITSASPRGVYSMRSLQVKSIMDDAGGSLARITAAKDGTSYVAFQREGTPLEAVIRILHRFRADTLDWRVDKPMGTQGAKPAGEENLAW